MKTLALATAFAALLAGAAQAAETAQYEVRFDVTWTAESHPLDYPGNAHFSGLVGATHGDAYRIFADGRPATPGLEALAERGKHSPLDQEIQAAIETGTAGALFESGALFQFPGTISATFTADVMNPHVSVVAMIAPSPDWFAGVSNLSLRKDGAWVDSLTDTLFAWDAGTDHGESYAAADDDAMPRQSVRLSASPHFIDGNGLKPVGTVTFTRINKTASN